MDYCEYLCLKEKPPIHRIAAQRGLEGNQFPFIIKQHFECGMTLQITAHSLSMLLTVPPATRAIFSSTGVIFAKPPPSVVSKHLERR